MLGCCLFFQLLLNAVSDGVKQKKLSRNTGLKEICYMLYRCIYFTYSIIVRIKNYGRSKSRIILITTNEWSIKNWDIENYVDVFFYSIENDNPQIMTNLRNNGVL